MASVFRLCILATLLSLGACNPVELPLPAETPPRIVLLGELVAGDSLKIRAGRSQAFASATHDIAEFESAMQITASRSGSQTALVPYEDNILYTTFTTLFSHPEIVQPQTDYVLNAAVAGLTSASVNVSVPAAFEGSATLAGAVQRQGDSMHAVNIRIGAASQGSRFVIEILRSPVHLSARFFFDGIDYDYEPNRALYDSLIRSGEQIDIMRDTAYSDLIERQPFYANRSSAENTSPGSQRSYHWFFINNAAPDLGFRIFIPRDKSSDARRVYVRIKSVSADYYDFLKSYEISHLQPVNPNNALLIKPTSASGNVNGGMGIVGGVFLREAVFVL